MKFFTFVYFSNFTILVFNKIGRVINLSNPLRIAKEGCQIISVFFQHLRSLLIFFFHYCSNVSSTIATSSLWTVPYIVLRSLVNSKIVISYIPATISNLMHSANLGSCLRKDGPYCISKTLQVICKSDKNIFNSTSLNVCKNTHPKCCTLCFANPKAKNLFFACLIEPYS